MIPGKARLYTEHRGVKFFRQAFGKTGIACRAYQNSGVTHLYCNAFGAGKLPPSKSVFANRQAIKKTELHAHWIRWPYIRFPGCHQ